MIELILGALALTISAERCANTHQFSGENLGTSFANSSGTSSAQTKMLACDQVDYFNADCLGRKSIRYRQVLIYQNHEAMTRLSAYDKSFRIEDVEPRLLKMSYLIGRPPQ